MLNVYQTGSYVPEARGKLPPADLRSKDLSIGMFAGHTRSGYPMPAWVFTQSEIIARFQSARRALQCLRPMVHRKRSHGVASCPSAARSAGLFSRLGVLQTAPEVKPGPHWEDIHGSFCPAEREAATFLAAAAHQMARSVRQVRTHYRHTSCPAAAEAKATRILSLVQAALQIVAEVQRVSQGMLVQDRPQGRTTRFSGRREARIRHMPSPPAGPAPGPRKRRPI